MKNRVLFVGVILISMVLAGCNKGGEDPDTVKVGLLHSLTGTMAISENPVRDSELMAIK